MRKTPNLYTSNVAPFLKWTSVLCFTRNVLCLFGYKNINKDNTFIIKSEKTTLQLIQADLKMCFFSFSLSKKKKCNTVKKVNNYNEKPENISSYITIKPCMCGSYQTL